MYLVLTALSVRYHSGTPTGLSLDEWCSGTWEAVSALKRAGWLADLALSLRQRVLAAISRQVCVVQWTLFSSLVKVASRPVVGEGCQRLLATYAGEVAINGRRVRNSANPRGAGGTRTPYLFNAIEALSQLSYSPTLSQYSKGGPCAQGQSRKWRLIARGRRPRISLSPAPAGRAGWGR